jgi:hypothetical protein
MALPKPMEPIGSISSGEGGKTIMAAKKKAAKKPAAKKKASKKK